MATKNNTTSVTLELFENNSFNMFKNTQFTSSQNNTDISM